MFLNTSHFNTLKCWLDEQNNPVINDGLKNEDFSFLSSYCRENPEDPEGWTGLGLYWMGQNVLEEARQCFGKALEHSHVSPRYLWVNAWAEDTAGNHEHCYTFLKKYLAVSNSDSKERKSFARQRVLDYEILRYKNLMTATPKTKRAHKKAANVLKRAV